MNPFEGLKRLFTSDVSGYLPADDIFVQPDKERTAKDLRLSSRGKEQGELELPASDNSALDVVEREISNDVTQLLNEAHIGVCNNIRSYEDRLADLQLLHGLGSIKAETKKVLGDFKVIGSNWNQHLSTRRDALRASYKKLTSFEREHGLSGPFEEVESRWVHISAILIAWFVETAGNTFFLRVNDEMGIAGGIVAAAFVAAVNVAFAVAAGIFIFPRTNFRDRAKRFQAWGWVGLWTLFTLLWNLAAAHFRDAKFAGVANPEVAVLDYLASDPFGLDSFYSWGLLAIGLFAAALSAHQGYKADDPYPGYGAIGRKHNSRCQQYVELVAEAKGDLTEQRNRAIEAAQAVKEELGRQMRERGRIHAAHAHMLRRYKEHRGRLEEFGNYLLQVYRNANLRARSSPAPTHFKDNFELPPVDLPPLHEEAVSQEKVEAAETALDKAIDAISDAFDEAIASFTPLEDLKKDLEHGAL